MSENPRKFQIKHKLKFLYFLVYLIKYNFRINVLFLELMF